MSTGFALSGGRHGENSDWPPDGERPGMLRAGPAVARSADAAMWIATFDVYSSGISFTVQVRRRSNAPDNANGATLALDAMLHGGLRTEGRYDTPAADGERPVASIIGARSRARAAQIDFWLRPLPKVGGVYVYAHWLPPTDLHEEWHLTEAELHEAAANLITLWP